MSLLPVRFETPRLVARLPVMADAARLFSAYTSDPAVSRYMVWRPHTLVAQTEDFIAGCLRSVEAGSRYPYVLSLKARPEEPIGMLEARPSGHMIDLGYVLARSSWGNGYMPEAVSALASVALRHAALFRVQAFCDVRNVPSQRTLEKAGFVREGRHERFMIHPNLDEEPSACYMYARCR